MKVCELIDKLQKADPESTLIFSVGRNCFGDNELEIELDEYEQEEDDEDYKEGEKMCQITISVVYDSKGCRV